MKKMKFGAVLLAAALLVSVLAPASVMAADNPTPGYLADLTTEENAKACKIVNFKEHDVKWSWADGAAKITAGACETGKYTGAYGNNPSFRFGTLKGEDKTQELDAKYKYMVIRLKNLTDGTQLGGLIASGSHGLDTAVAGGGIFKLDINPSMTEFKTYVFDMTAVNEGAADGNNRWKNDVKQIQVEFSFLFGERGAAVPENTDLLELKWVAFFESEEDAKAYKGPAGTDASVNEQNATPVDPDPTDPAPTDPAPTTAPTESGDKEDNGPTGDFAVISFAVLTVAVLGAAVCILRKKHAEIG